MAGMVNRQVRLRSRPLDIPQASDFAIVSEPVPPLAEGEVLVRNRFLSVEPAMRGWVSAVGNYAQPVAIDAVMRAFAVGEVIASRHPDHHEGDRVHGAFGWQEFAVVEPDRITATLPDDGLPLSLHLGVLGLTGMTAYFALLDIGRPQAGETVVVSTAAGSVGSCVGQIAKRAGCHTVGIAGGAEKTRQCRDRFGYDAAIDYKAEDVGAALSRAAPDGVDVYFDNTAGPISDAVLPLLAVHARVIVCGTAAISSWAPWPSGPRVERHLLVKRALMQGFLFFDIQHRAAEARAALTAWVREGSLRYAEHILDGIEQAPGAIAMLYRGENTGKLLVRLPG